MIEWLITCGTGFLAKEVIGELAKVTKGAAEGYLKDFFKQHLSNAIGGIRKKEPWQKAMAKATQEFLDLIEEELLVNVGLDKSQLKQYSQPLTQFIKNKSVLEILGSAFDKNLKVLDTKTLATIWNQINPPLPDEFNWYFVAEKYRRKCKNISLELDKLREILDSENLMKLVDNIQIKPEFDLERYQEVIQKEYGNLNLESLDTSAYLDNDLNLLKLWPMFIPQNVRNSQEYLPQVHEIPKGYLKEFKDSEQLEEKFNQEKLESLRRTYFQQQTCSVLELVENQNSQYLVILGDPGSGKSTLLQYIALKWAKLLPKDLPSYPIPLLIELKTYIRNYNDHNYTNFLEFLEKSSGVICNFPQHELDGQLKNGNGIVMFDGLDEVFDHTQREEVITNIKKFASIYKKVKVIVTSRVIGYEAKTFKNANFSHYMLEDLDEKQIEDFIQRWHQFAYEKPEDRQWRKERLLKAIKSSSAIQQIAGNPLLLTMMAIMNRNLELAKNKSDLYSKASEFLLNWNVELAHSKVDYNSNVPKYINYKDKQAMLRQMAYFMQNNGEDFTGNFIRGDDVESIIKKYLESIDIENARGIARELKEQLRSRNFILCYVGAELGIEYYAFVHRTFWEFFCAWEFVWQFKETRDISIDKLKEEVFGNHWQDEKWHEILRLIAGLIAPKFVGEIINYLMEQDGKDEKFMNLFLASKCLFEVRFHQPIKDIASELLSKLIDLTNYNIDNIDYDSEICTQAVAVVAEIWRDYPQTKICLNHIAEFHNDLNVQDRAREELVKYGKND